MNTVTQREHPLLNAPDSTVLFVDFVGSTRLYEQAGDETAFSLVTTCLDQASEVVANRGGRTIKNTGDGLMAVLPGPDAAADCAAGIHATMRDCPSLANYPTEVRIGFHTGPLLARDNDIFGEAVNVAARLTALASPGRALTTEVAAKRMITSWRDHLRPLPPRFLRGVSKQVALFELPLEPDGATTRIYGLPDPIAEAPELRLTWGNNRSQINGWQPVARLGRDPISEICIDDPRVSRQHAGIELRGDKFLLRDHSSNGTYVSISGTPEFILSREEVVLHGSGWLSLGRGREGNPWAIGFICA
ncbi:MAG TPA: FHA domain-containing protein [Azoarcus sp.]|nr:FHA domain-containing protein [Azoarcus sp.]